MFLHQILVRISPLELLELRLTKRLVFFAIYFPFGNQSSGAQLKNAIPTIGRRVSHMDVLDLLACREPAMPGLNPLAQRRA